MAFLAYENAIVAVAEAKEIRWEKIHAKKAELAKKLCGDGILRTDVSETLRELNELRKNVEYDEPGQALSELDLEELISNLEEFINEVEGVITHGK